MNIICPHCGRKHALFYYVSGALKKVCYICDHFEKRRLKRLTGYTEIQKVTQRCVYHESLTKEQMDALPIEFSKGVLKKENDAHQEKLKL
jgi:hypothetical protein